MKYLFLLLLCNAFSIQTFAQEEFELAKVDTVVPPESGEKLDYKRFALPAVCVAYGVASLKVDALKRLNASLTDKLRRGSGNRFVWDNLSQHVPLAMVYGLNLAGVRGEHNLRDRSIIYLTSAMIMTSIVLPAKHLIQESRPDNQDTHSFPSGHTATAFVAAQFMFREYKNKHLLLALSGYPWAVFTGMQRIASNRHHLGDVIAGAGIGIFSTEIAYWLYPKINRFLVGKKQKSQIMLSPYYLDKGAGVSLVKVF